MQQHTAAATQAWQTVETSTYVHVITQLQNCQQLATTAILCDMAGIGKTYAGKQFAHRHKGAVYLDCSQCKTKSLFIRTLAEGFGLQAFGRLHDVMKELIKAILHANNPIVILDEAGDLDYPAFLEWKAIYNATEYRCGWYFMGAQGLEAKMERNRANRKVGYEEIFDRLGARYQSITEDMDGATRALMLRHQASAILKANMPGISKQQSEGMLKACELNLRRLYKEVIKARTPELAFA